MDKPQEFTSFDVIGKLRGILHLKRLGHTGTLDPMATGVLPVLVGTATKACDILPNQDKTYRAEVQFGYETDTQDRWGRTVQTFPILCCPHLSAASNRFRRCIQRFPSADSGYMIWHVKV